MYFYFYIDCLFERESKARNIWVEKSQRKLNETKKNMHISFILSFIHFAFAPRFPKNHLNMFIRTSTVSINKLLCITHIYKLHLKQKIKFERILILEEESGKKIKNWKFMSKTNIQPHVLWMECWEKQSKTCYVMHERKKKQIYDDYQHLFRIFQFWWLKLTVNSIFCFIFLFSFLFHASFSFLLGLFWMRNSIYFFLCFLYCK